MEKATQQALDRDALLERLRAEHSALEARLAELDRHIALTQDEQLERAQIKKQKLAKKDLIASIQRSLTHDRVAAPPGEAAQGTAGRPRVPPRPGGG